MDAKYLKKHIRARRKGAIVNPISSATEKIESRKSGETEGNARQFVSLSATLTVQNELKFSVPAFWPVHLVVPSVSDPLVGRIARN